MPANEGTNSLRRRSAGVGACDIAGDWVCDSGRYPQALLFFTFFLLPAQCLDASVCLQKPMYRTQDTAHERLVGWRHRLGNQREAVRPVCWMAGWLAGYTSWWSH